MPTVVVYAGDDFGDVSYALGMLTCPRCGRENPEGARFCRLSMRKVERKWDRRSAIFAKASGARCCKA